MKAAYCAKAKKITLNASMDVPKISTSEMLIKVKYAGICGSDIHVYNGGHRTATFPLVPGHEFVGVVKEIGDEYKGEIKVGDTVVSQPFYSCNNCEPCVTGNDNVCSHVALLGIHTLGCFAEYVKVPAKKVYKLPDDIDLPLASLAEPLAVAVHDVRNSDLKVGEKALIIGGGPIGMIIGMVARLAGAEVYISEVNDFRLSFSKKLGFSTLNPMDADFSEQVKNATDGKGFDVVFEVSGSKPGVASMTDLVKISGTVMVVGMVGDKYPVDLMNVFLKQINIKGVRIHSQKSFAGAVEILKSGKLNEDLKTMISKTFSLEDVEKAYEYVLTEKEYFKVLLKV